MSLIKGPKASLTGLILARLLVPAWITAGAVFKLAEHTPRLLPQSIREIGMIQLDIPAYPLLATLIALEFMAVGIMVSVPKFARSVALAMMGMFCVILIAEIAMGNTSCGCLGANSPSPGVMLGIDGTLLLGLILFSAERGGLGSPLVKRDCLFAAIATAIGAAVAFGLILPLDKDVVVPPVADGGGDAPVEVVIYDPANPINSAAVPPPSVYYIGHMDIVDSETEWEGKSWRDVDLFTYMKQWPKGLDKGERYVIFYSRTCDHCEEMFEFDLSDPNWSSKVTAVEVPASPTVMTDEAGWPMPETDVEHLTLPMGCDYVITTPLVFKIVDGIIECAHESGHEECMGLDPDR